MSLQTDKFRVYSALLNQCDKEIDEIYHYYAARYNLSDAALWILYAMYEADDPVTQADLCSFWFLSRQTIHTAFIALKKLGIIESVAIPGNRKSKRIVFTESGKALAEQVIPPLQQAEKQVFDAFTDEENENFINMSQKRCFLLRHFLNSK